MINPLRIDRRYTSGNSSSRFGVATVKGLSLLVAMVITASVPIKPTSGFIGVWCDTPVYRYAMYRWQPADYELYCITTNESRESFAETRRQIDSLLKEADAPNLFIIDIDASRDVELLSIPPAIRRAWRNRDDDVSCGVVLATPRGQPLFAGSVDADRLAPLFDSPLRQRIGGLTRQPTAKLWFAAKTCKNYPRANATNCALNRSDSCFKCSICCPISICATTS